MSKEYWTYQDLLHEKLRDKRNKRNKQEELEEKQQQEINDLLMKSINERGIKAELIEKFSKLKTRREKVLFLSQLIAFIESQENNPNALLSFWTTLACIANTPLDEWEKNPFESLVWHLEPYKEEDTSTLTWTVQKSIISITNKLSKDPKVKEWLKKYLKNLETILDNPEGFDKIYIEIKVPILKEQIKKRFPSIATEILQTSEK